MNVGDVVVLKSEKTHGYWTMTVQSPEFTREIRLPSFAGDKKQVMSFVSCAWMDANGVLQNAELLVDTLERVECSNTDSQS